MQTGYFYFLPPFFMSKDQLHKRFTTEQVKMLLQWYEARTLTDEQVCERLIISRAQFFRLLERYRRDPTGFTLIYRRSYPPPNRYDRQTDAAIFTELERVTGIEPVSSAWKADALPLCYTRAEPKITKKTKSTKMTRIAASLIIPLFLVKL